MVGVGAGLTEAPGWLVGGCSDADADADADWLGAGRPGVGWADGCCDAGPLGV